MSVVGYRGSCSVHHVVVNVHLGLIAGEVDNGGVAVAFDVTHFGVGIGVRGFKRRAKVLAVGREHQVVELEAVAECGIFQCLLVNIKVLVVLGHLCLVCSRVGSPLVVFIGDVLILEIVGALWHRVPRNKSVLSVLCSLSIFVYGIVVSHCVGCGKVALRHRYLI